MIKMHTLPCFLKLANVSERPTVGAEVRVAIGLIALVDNTADF